MSHPSFCRPIALQQENGVAATPRTETPGGRRLWVGLSWVALTLVVVESAWAFHDGGVANCDGCHVVHDSIDGRPVNPEPGNNYQLIAESPSDVCLVCHAEQLGAVLGLDPLRPPAEKGAGNFVFLTEDNLNDGTDGRFNPIPGDAAGHNIVAPGHGLIADFRYTESPGGSFPASELGCTSCHDPHGRATFQMLYGVGEIQGGLQTFSNPAPTAVGIDLRNGEESRTEHTVYYSRMSRWCGNCHGRYHEGGLSPFQHPTDVVLGVEERRQYSIYEGDDKPTGGMASTSYIPEVPIEDLSFGPGSSLGPSPTGRVLCLSCHRAHASSSPAAGRWDFHVALLEDDGVESGSWPLPNPYGPNQGSLCRKCHQTIPENP